MLSNEVNDFAVGDVNCSSAINATAFPNSNECSDIRLDQEGRSQEHIPLYFQDADDCAGWVAVDLVMPSDLVMAKITQTGILKIGHLTSKQLWDTNFVANLN